MARTADDGKTDAPVGPRRSRAKEEHSKPGRKSELVGRPPREELTPQQLRGIAAVLNQPTLAAAAGEVGVHPRTISRWFRERAFTEEYRRQMTELQAELWHRMLAVRNDVLTRFLELMRGGDDRIALRATMWYLDRILTVPAPIGRSNPTDLEAAQEVSPRLRALLAQVDTVPEEEEEEGERHASGS